MHPAKASNRRILRSFFVGMQSLGFGVASRSSQTSSRCRTGCQVLHIHISWHRVDRHLLRWRYAYLVIYKPKHAYGITRCCCRTGLMLRSSPAAKHGVMRLYQQGSSVASSSSRVAEDIYPPDNNCAIYQQQYQCILPKRRIAAFSDHSLWVCSLWVLG